MQAGGSRYVLRKKPPGRVLASAHAVEREFQVLAALQATPVPVPAALCLCSDASVLGTPFYVMGHVQVGHNCCSEKAPCSSHLNMLAKHATMHGNGPVMQVCGHACECGLEASTNNNLAVMQVHVSRWKHV